MATKKLDVNGWRLVLEIIIAILQMIVKGIPESEVQDD